MAAEVDALCDRSRDERRRDDRKLALEHHEHQFGNALVGEELHVGDIAEKYEARVPHDGSAEGLPERQAVAEDYPLHADDRHGEERMHHRREDVLATHHAAVEECQARHHQQHHR